MEVRLGTIHMPSEFKEAHNLCFLFHDVLVEALRSGEEHEVFQERVKFANEEDRERFEEASDIFEWLEDTKRETDRGRVLCSIVFPALLSDSLLCIYDALKASERGRLSTTYMLVRKPLQESLFLFEQMLIEPTQFGNLLANEPLKLRAGKAGGVEPHQRRIAKALCFVNDSRFNAEYLAKLRYDKTSDDSFDAICNQAMHLFTEHHAIRTTELNINFIFSGDDERLRQWKYLYSRLPYLLAYFYAVTENVLGNIVGTDPGYLELINRKILAQICLWSDTVGEDYWNEELANFVRDSHASVNAEYEKAGLPAPSKKQIKELRNTGVIR